MRTVPDASEIHAPTYPFGGVSVFQSELWPRPRDLWGPNLYDDALLLGRAPFQSAEGLRDEELICSYAAAPGELPGGLSRAAVRSREFMYRLVVGPALLRPEFRRSNTEARG